MALVKTVEMRILADAGNAQEKLDALAAEADKLDGNDIHMRFRVDSANARAQLDEMRARATEAGFRDVTIKLKVDGAGRAIADLRAVKHEEDVVRDASILDRLGGLTGRLGGALGGAAGAFPGVGGAGVPGGAIGLGVLAAGVAALLPEVTALASGFAAAGAGAGAFALLALPAVKRVETAYQALGKAQQAYQQAQAKQAADPSKANEAALARARTQLDLTWATIAKMPAAEQDAMGGIHVLGQEFGKLSRAFEPQAFTVFAAGLKVINGLLPQVTPFANTFAHAITGLLNQLGKATQSKGFADFLKQFHSLEGPAITSIGQGIGKVAAAFGHLLTLFSGKDVAHAINIAFGGIAGTINAVTTAVRFLMTAWDGMGIAIGNVKGAVHDVAATFDRVRHGLADSAHSWASTFDQVRHAVASAAHNIASAFDGIRHDIAAKFDGIKGAVAAKFAGAAGWLKGVAHDLASAFDNVRHDIAAKFNGVKGAILGAFSGAAGWLVSAGKAIIQGLINGIESMASAVGSAISHIASTIRSFLPFSPAKQGPLSGSGSPDIAGAKIAQMLAGGMDAGSGAVARSAARLAGAAGVTPAMAGGGYGGGHHYEIHLHGVIDKQGAAREIHQLMLEYKRNGGRAALGLA